MPLSALCLILAVATVPGPLSPGDVPQHDAVVGTDPRAAEVATYRRHVESLTTTAMGGRATGTAGGGRAVAYVERAFAELGLSRCDGVDGYLQAFTVRDPRPRRLADDADCAATSRTGGPVALAVGRDVVPFRFSPAGTADGDVVFVGHGLRVPALDWDDYARRDVDGKIVVALRGLPAGDVWAAHATAARFSAKIEHAAAAGAAGFVLVSADEVDRERDREIVQLALEARGRASIPAAWMTRGAAAALLEVAEDRLGRACRHRAADSKHARLRLRVAWRAEPEPLETANVVGVVRGSDPAARGVLVVGAHHDHIGDGRLGSLADDGVGRLHPGADDNASGLAAMLLLAERLVARPAARDVVFVAFGAEKLGQRGSREFVRRGPMPRESIVAMVNLDMVGRATPERLRIEGVGTGAGFEELVSHVSASTGAVVRRRAETSLRSDHWSFLAVGIPALLFHSGLHDDYHRPTDTSDRILVGPAVAATDLAAIVVRALAEPSFRSRFTARRVGHRWVPDSGR